MNSVFFDPALSDDERRDLIYSGQLGVCWGPPGGRSFVALTRELRGEAFGGLVPSWRSTKCRPRSMRLSSTI